MSKTIPLVALGAALVFAQSAQALEVTGGSIALSYSAFTDESDFNRLALEGSVEVGINRNAAVQLDLGFNDFGTSDESTEQYGVHGIYHIDDATSLGAFYATDQTSGGDLDVFGIEAGHETGQFDLEGYVSRVDDSGTNANAIGASARYAANNGVGFTGSIDSISFDGDVDLTRYGLKIDREVTPNGTLFVEVGTLSASAFGVSDNETFVGLGGKITFGANRGATFEQRSILRLLPGL